MDKAYFSIVMFSYSCQSRLDSEQQCYHLIRACIKPYQRAEPEISDE